MRLDLITTSAMAAVSNFWRFENSSGQTTDLTQNMTLRRPFQHASLDVLVEDKWCEAAREKVAADVSATIARIERYVEELGAWKTCFVRRWEKKEEFGMWRLFVPLRLMEYRVRWMEKDLQTLTDAVKREQEVDDYCVAIKSGGSQNGTQDA